MGDRVSTRTKVKITLSRIHLCVRKNMSDTIYEGMIKYVPALVVSTKVPSFLITSFERMKVIKLQRLNIFKERGAVII